MKLPGYRSKTGWKMGLATLGYGLLLLGLIVIIMGPFTDEAANVNGITAQNVQEHPPEILEVRDGLVVQYQDEIKQITSSLNAAFLSLNDHLESFDTSSDWIETARTENNATYALATRFKEFQNVPGHFTPIHAIFLDSYHDIEQFHVMFAEALDVMEAKDIEKGRGMMHEAIPYLETAQTFFYQAHIRME
ncbi:hypothetical protein [Halalkalibacter alkalisediminis]|uniref:Chemotaxis methyl-accepting receptor HlyB-like 4HB MCP domain-containing protein n=1 Tax=Halalkalibacter alkalisediminis TaxID=935616 RepID=A0ABV6NCF4_9BACI|nr:hypothetical protein [Halalkalibacter alkalisediminis]